MLKKIFLPPRPGFELTLFKILSPHPKARVPPPRAYLPLPWPWPWPQTPPPQIPVRAAAAAAAVNKHNPLAIGDQQKSGIGIKPRYRQKWDRHEPQPFEPAIPIFPSTGQRIPTLARGLFSYVM